MIVRSILIGVLFIFFNTFSQNLIPNGSFENYTKCPTGYSQNKNDDNIRTIEYAYPWRQASHGTSDLISGCSEDPQFTLPQIGYQDGKACAAIYLAASYYPFQTTTTGCVVRNYREYIQVRLIQPMIQDVKYKFSMWVLPSAASNARTDAIGAYFTPNQIVNNIDTLGYNSTILGVPQIKNPLGIFLTDTSKWELIQGVYTALGGESYVTIGNFTNDMQTTITGGNGEDPYIFGCQVPSYNTTLAYYFIDNISLLPCGNPVKNDAGTDTSYICFGEDNVTLSPRIVASQKEYKWNTGATDSNLTVTPGIYTVRIILKDDDCFNNDTLVKKYIVKNSPHNYDTTFCKFDFDDYEKRGSFYAIGQYFKDSDLKILTPANDTGTYYYKPYLTQKCKNIKPRKITIIANTQQELMLQPASFCERDTINISVSTVNSNIQWYLNFQHQVNWDGRTNIDFYNNQSNYPFISATFTDKFGCNITTPYVSLYSRSIPKITISPKDTGICPGQEISLKVQSSAYSVEWYDGSTENSIKVSKPGYYKVSSWYSDDCKRSDSALVRMLPVPNFKLSSDSAYCFGYLIPLILNAREGYKQYVWNLETTTGHTFKVNASGTVNLKVVDQNNCTNISKINLINQCDDPVLPNVFTPNEDGVNEKFEIRNLLPQSELVIFNRWGTKVFNSSNYTNDWKAEGLVDGVYYYHLNNRFYDHQTKGWIEIIR